MWHRLWKCPKSEDLLGKLPRRLVERARAHPEALLFVKGWAAKPQFPVPLDGDFLFGFERGPLSTREESSQAYVEASYERLQQYLCVLKNLPLLLSSDFEKLVDSATVFRNRAKRRRNRV